MNIISAKVTEKDFKWWDIWGILNFLFDLSVFITALRGLTYFINNLNHFLFVGLIGGIIVFIHFIITIGIFKYNKRAFLFSIIYFNLFILLMTVPYNDSIIIGIIIILFQTFLNSIYLANRWCHPKINNGKKCGKYIEDEIIKGFNTNS